MAETFTFELVSPEKLLLSNEASMVTLPGADGDMGVMGNHAPVMTGLRPGYVEATLADGSKDEYFVRGGFADITPNAVTILAEFALPRAELTREVFEEQRAIAQSDYEAHHKAGDEEKAANARTYLDQLNHLEPTLLPA
jgi:F-type H+-transporting ATPase subunit epsilon